LGAPLLSAYTKRNCPALRGACGDDDDDDDGVDVDGVDDGNATERVAGDGNAAAVYSWIDGFKEEWWWYY
jgi:hypothetical protein